MHHNFTILQQVFTCELKPPKTGLCFACVHFWHYLLLLISKAFGKDPLDSDIDKRVNSDTESKEDKPAPSDLQLDEQTTKRRE